MSKTHKRRKSLTESERQACLGAVLALGTADAALVRDAARLQHYASRG